MTERGTQTPIHRTNSNQLFVKSKPFIFALMAAIVLVVCFFLTYKIINPQMRLERDKFQVVYLTNGQAYFGKLKNTTGDYLIMEQPYTQQTLQASESKSGDKVSSGQATLLKVSDQVYGPEDSIAIKSSQVAFWQNLRTDSKVTQAINAKQQTP